jgi:two-component system chemotaxis response regulator CheY
MSRSRSKDAAKPPLEGMRILVVEDNAHTAALVRQTLLAAGALEVAIAVDGSKAMSALRTFKPDVLVTDRMMPVTDGMTLIRSVRQAALEPNAHVPDPAVPIVLVSGFSSHGGVREARAAGIDAFVVKPFSVDSLVKRVERAGKRKAAFIVTDGYIGPDRRARAGEGDRRRSDRMAPSPNVSAPKAPPPTLLKTLYERIQDLEQEREPQGV